MKKSEIIKKVATVTGLNQKQVAEVLDSFVEILRQTIKSENKVRVHNLGTFSVVDRAPRKIRTPLTGGEIELPAMKRVKFTPSSDLKAFVNGVNG